LKISGSGGSGTPTGWPLAWWASQAAGALATVKLSNPANQLNLYGFVLPCALAVGKIIYNVTTLDAGGLYDIGLYTYAGVLVGDIGAQSVPATGVITKAFAQGSISLNPGKYFLGTTGNAITAAISVANPGPGAWSFQAAGSLGATTAGVLPASCSPPADSNEDILVPVFALTA
jgi:hypothetical protein